MNRCSRPYRSPRRVGPSRHRPSAAIARRPDPVFDGLRMLRPDGLTGGEVAIHPIGVDPSEAASGLSGLTGTADPDQRELTGSSARNEASVLNVDVVQELEAPRRSLTALAITHYSEPGGLVVDLGCGHGRALVEAIRTDRLAIGIERNPRLASEAREAVVQATAQGGPGFAAVVVGELADVPQLVGSDSLRRASLVLVDLLRAGEDRAAALRSAVSENA